MVTRLVQIRFHNTNGEADLEAAAPRPGRFGQGPSQVPSAMATARTG